MSAATSATTSATTSAICPWAYVNGRYIAAQSAQISPFDRGFLFADAGYEVTAVFGGRLVDGERHMARLARTLSGLSFPRQPDTVDLLVLHRELIARNRLDEGSIYLQVSRGCFPARDFAPPGEAEPTVFAFAQSTEVSTRILGRSGLRVVTTPDLRWSRRDLKTTSLIAQCLAKMDALNKGVDDAWMVDADGLVTESSSANAWIVTGQGSVVTRHLSQDVLAGVTRAGVLELSGDTVIEERAFSVSEAHHAAEAFNTSSTKALMPVVEIDGRTIGDGHKGPVTQKLENRYLEAVSGR